MPRDISAYINDIIDASDSISDILCGISLEEYSSCERKDRQWKESS